MSESKEKEVDDVVSAIIDYVKSGNYVVHDDNGPRPLGYGDIAVISRNTSFCRLIRDACERRNIPAYLQGDVQIMCTREGKLALAWLRYVNNDRDPWAVVPIMADMGYSPVEIEAVVSSKFAKVPEAIVAQRKSLYRRRRRITDLLATIFQFYGLDNDITQAIINTMSSIHRGTLLTISDVIRIMEDDIENQTAYPVENFIDSKAVTIMTMHKSKGLEFPAVICPFIDQRVMPSMRGDSDVFCYSDDAGIRCRREIARYEGYSKITDDWRTKLILGLIPRDYSEERRLMFVALSRAKQYITVISGPKPSFFMTDLSDGETTIPKIDLSSDRKTRDNIARPVLPGYSRRISKLGVHEILDFTDDEGKGCPEGCDEISGKGMEYGTEVHRIAEDMCNGKAPDKDYPEVEQIRKVLDSVKDADMLCPEIECGLPVDGTEVVLRGVIDLLALYPDRIEIHDYKTDVSDRFEPEYIIQLSVYAHAAMRFYGLPVRCFIDYVSMGYSKPIEVVEMDEIALRTRAKLTDIFIER